MASGKAVAMALLAILAIVVIAVTALSRRTPVIPPLPPTPPPPPPPALFYATRRDGNIYAVDDSGNQTQITTGGGFTQLATNPGDPRVYAVADYMIYPVTPTSGQPSNRATLAPIPGSQWVSAVGFDTVSRDMYGLNYSDHTLYHWSNAAKGWDGAVPHTTGAVATTTFGPSNYIYGISLSDPKTPMKFLNTMWAPMPSAPGPLSALVYDETSGLFYALRADSGEILTSPDLQVIPLSPSGFHAIPGGVGLALAPTATAASPFTVIVKRRPRRRY